jgi:tetratricopeptide (TPR) repeat protein
MLQASLLEALDRPGEAADAYRRISELDPDNPLAYWRMGSALLAGGQPEEAYQAFLEAERLGMEEVALFVSLGNLEAGRSDLEAAGRHYRRALGLAPEDTEIRLRLGLVLHAAGDPAAAIEVLEPLGGAENVLAEIYFEAGRYEAALAAYRTLVGENPGSTDDWMGLARSAYALDRYGEALDALDEVVTRDPERAAAWGLLGAIHHEAGNYRAAVPALLRRLGLRPDDATSHFMVATAFDNLEDAESALLHYNRFLELDDGSDDARTFQVRRRAELLEKLPR